MSSKEKYLKPDVIRQIARLDLKAKFIVEGFISGLHRSPYKGFSVEFSEHRKYNPGDEISRMDWGVWARTDKYYLKQFKAETNQQSYILLDSSLSMAYQYGKNFSKLDYAICVAASLGYLMLHQQDALGLVVFDQKIQKMLKPSSKRTHLNVILKELMQIKPSLPSSISDCLHETAKRIRKKGILMIFSDFIPVHSSSKKDPLEEELIEIQKALQHFRSQSQDIMVFQILDESEAHFSFDDPMRFKDPESGLIVEAGPEVRENYLQVLQDYQRKLQEICAKEKVDFLALHTGENFDRPLMSFLLKRKNKF